MNPVLKLVIGFTVATAVSIFSGALSLLILKSIVDFYQMNHEKDAYWVFNCSFYTMIFFWIISFVLTLILIDTN